MIESRVLAVSPLTFSNSKRFLNDKHEKKNPLLISQHCSLQSSVVTMKTISAAATFLLLLYGVVNIMYAPSEVLLLPKHVPKGEAGALVSSASSLATFVTHAAASNAPSMDALVPDAASSATSSLAALVSHAASDATTPMDTLLVSHAASNDTSMVALMAALESNAASNAASMENTRGCTRVQCGL
jgi:hypothetical protein